MSDPSSSSAAPQSIPYRSGLARPVVGMEAEFVVLLDGKEVEPEAIWSAPTDFVRARVLKRATKASQLPTGGAIYFDKGVIELVTPVIEIAPGCTARMVRSLWEQVALVRAELDRWGKENRRDVRLRGFSAHYNVSFELPREERGKDRTVQKLALLLAHVLPIPILVAAANRRSSGVGVRPRRDRVEITVDFTPDPGLMLATAALAAGIVRGVIGWPSYRIEELDRRGIPRLAAFEPGRHTTRKGWLARAEQFGRDPGFVDIDRAEWPVEGGKVLSFRDIATRTAEAFRTSIEAVADPFSTAVLFALLGGRLHSLLELEDRPAEYDDVGRATKWGSALQSYEDLSEAPERHRRSADAVKLGAPWTAADAERRSDSRSVDRRTPVTEKERRELSRSAYESTFIRLVTCDAFVLAGRALRPQRIEAWYHVVCSDETTGEELLVPIEEIASGEVEWRSVPCRP